VTEILKLAKLIQHHRVAQMDIRGSRIETKLAAQRRAGFSCPCQFLQKLILNQKRIGAALDECERIPVFLSYGVFLHLICSFLFFCHRCI